MVDMLKTIEAKSDRLNADDLMGGDRIIRIEAVKAGNAESPVAVFYEGCNGKPWYPAKTMRRAIVAAWGERASDYIGKSIKIYRDPNVIYGGIAVGGIRIRAFSDIEGPLTLMLAEKRGKKTQFQFQKLEVASHAPVADITDQLPGAISAIRAAKTEASLEKMLAHSKFIKLREALGDRAGELDRVVAEKRGEFAPVDVVEEPENANTTEERVISEDDF